MVIASTIFRLEKAFTPARSNSLWSSGMSNRAMLNPATSLSRKTSRISPSESRNVGLSLTSSSRIPCIRVASSGMAISGLKRHSYSLRSPLGHNLITASSTIRSIPTIVPVVSKSKKANGRVRERLRCSAPCLVCTLLSLSTFNIGGINA